MNDIYRSIYKLKDVKDNQVEIPIIKIAKYKNTKYGDFEFTQNTLDDIKSNFEDNVIGRDVIVDKEHNHENLGMVSSLFQRGKELIANVILNESGNKTIGKFKYASPEIWSKYINKLTGKIAGLGNVLKFVSLTNDPFQVGLSGIVALSDEADLKIVILNEKQEDINMSEELVKKLNDEITELTDSNSEMVKTLEDKENEIKSLSDKVEGLETEKKELSDKIEEVKKVEFDTKVERFLSDNSKADENGFVKITPKNYEDFKKLSETKEGFEKVMFFVDNSEGVKLGDEETEGDSDSKEKTFELGDKDDPAIKKLTDNGMSYFDAVHEVYPNGVPLD